MYFDATEENALAQPETSNNNFEVFWSFSLVKIIARIKV